MFNFLCKKYMFYNIVGYNSIFFPFVTTVIGVPSQMTLHGPRDGASNLLIQTVFRSTSGASMLSYRHRTLNIECIGSSKTLHYFQVICDGRVLSLLIYFRGFFANFPISRILCIVSIWLDKMEWLFFLRQCLDSYLEWYYRVSHPHIIPLGSTEHTDVVGRSFVEGHSYDISPPPPPGVTDRKQM